LIFDHKAFHKYKDDWFDRDYWESCEPWWMLVNGIKIGCCAFERNVDVSDDPDQDNPPSPGSLYISTTGILPSLQGKGFGDLLKCWEIQYARHHRFSRIVTNHRESNTPVIRLNEKFGFKVTRTISNYYDHPAEPAVVMELLLRRTGKPSSGC
jgi:ribosomal protein S18 acetylase RimI-like enzyme